MDVVPWLITCAGRVAHDEAKIKKGTSRHADKICPNQWEKRPSGWDIHRRLQSSWCPRALMSALCWMLWSGLSARESYRFARLWQPRSRLCMWFSHGTGVLLHNKNTNCIELTLLCTGSVRNIVGLSCVCGFACRPMCCLGEFSPKQREDPVAASPS